MSIRSVAVAVVSLALVTAIASPARAAGDDPWLASMTIPGALFSVGDTVTVQLAANTLQRGALDGTIQFFVRDETTGGSQPVSSALPASDFATEKAVTFPTYAAGSFTAAARFTPSAASTTAASEITGRFTVMRHDATVTLNHADAVVGTPLTIAVAIDLPNDIGAVGGTVKLVATSESGDSLTGECVPALTGDSMAGCTVGLTAPQSSGRYGLLAIWQGSPGFIEGGFQSVLDVAKSGTGGGTTSNSGTTGVGGAAPSPGVTVESSMTPVPSATALAVTTVSTFDPLPWVLLLVLVVLILVAALIVVVRRLRAPS